MLAVDGRTHSRLLYLLSEALNEPDAGERAKAFEEAAKAMEASEPPLTSENGERARFADAPAKRLSEDEIGYVNAVLPWSSFFVDASGRAHGNRYTAAKRNTPDSLDDPRIGKLLLLLGDTRPLSVAEYGCFEGNHTAQLCAAFAHVFALDGRIENCLKTLVRCWLLGQQPHVACINLEKEDAELPHADVTHHVGVLYHLTRPVEHLQDVLRRTGSAMLLDTQLADPEKTNASVAIAGVETPAFRYNEKDIAFAPFAGMEPFALWLTDEAICRIAEAEGFDLVEKDIRQERNGLRGTFLLKARA